MAYSLQNTINYTAPYVEYLPLNANVGGEPALSIATMIRNTILNPPFRWPWNRNTFALTGGNALVAGTQDYTLPITDFYFLEKASLTYADNSYSWELKDVYNTLTLGAVGSSSAGAQAQPEALAVEAYTPGVNAKFRFLSIPDQAYTGILAYQMMPLPFGYNFTVTACGNADAGATTYTGVFNPAYFPAGGQSQIAGFVTNSVNNGTFPIVSCTGTSLIVANPSGVAETHAATANNNLSWAPIPDTFIDVFNSLFLGEALELFDGASRGQVYRQRGIAALLAKSEGLSQLQINAFLAQYDSRGPLQALASQLRTQQGATARGI